MKIYKTKRGIVLEDNNSFCLLPRTDWDDFVNRDNLYEYAVGMMNQRPALDHAAELLEKELLPPIGSQEVWGAGVTYFKSREARIEEAKGAGGGDFYDRVYQAERPEIFFKASPARTVGSGNKVRIREDSNWNVPEPELTLVISSNEKIIGYTIGNDMSSRDIEGENPLYLPQAKTYDKCAAVGPCILASETPLPADTTIALEIIRGEKTVFSENTAINQMKRKPAELVNFLYRACSFPKGCFLMTGTGIVPPNDFTLDHNDEIRITVDHIGTLINFVE